MNKFLKPFFKIAGCITVLSTMVAGVAFIEERIEELKNYGKELKHKTYGVYEKFIKRPLDCFLSTGALIVFSPILAVIAFLVKTKLGSPVLFTQERPGKDEKIFKLYKFRTMTDARDENGELLPDDIRLTKFGKALRATSLDELPELINIVKGDMAVVGPRPLLVRDMVFMTLEQRKRHNVTPGLTGLAQVNGRNDILWEDKLVYDVKYIDDGITFKGDVKIVLDTVMKVFKSEGITERDMVTAMDLGDYLLHSGVIKQNEYEKKQLEAKELIGKCQIGDF
ncbi:sugar transferase [Ruminococcus albus]|uniref:Sugar transferase n=1 Tax=Ruminococcus albus (strain ATCC 27210 / DSM 20455 / JCM 14654 / NCDO 2250 / 7) TaxID=697329 RepID=E6UIQ1_RUMA7|nr:sugar transferase [Ruminococcus albus]ADU21353.1 sugar transferase [Ruminococcus albus 7 = DSM 20455]